LWCACEHSYRSNPHQK